VLNVVASGESLEEARAAAYAAIAPLRIGGEPPRFRRDVGDAGAWAERILAGQVDQPAAGLGAGQA
jgi:phosphoribosylamine-glycine ligase